MGVDGGHGRGVANSTEPPRGPFHLDTIKTSIYLHRSAETFTEF